VSAPISTSVIVATRDRPQALQACLRSLGGQQPQDLDFEVVVVNDGGAPVTDALAALPSTLRVRAIAHAAAGPGAARNAGAVVSHGECLAFLDDDCVAAPDWVARISARVAAQPDALVGGRTLNGLDENPWATASQLLVSYLYEYFQRHDTPARFFTSNNMALSAGRFKELGGFDTTNPRAVCEDRELCDRWLRLGRPLEYAPEAVVWHRRAMTFGGFLRQHFRYGRGAVHLRRLRVRRGSAPLPLEPASFYLGMVRYPFRMSPGAHPLRLAGLLALTQVAHTAGFVGEMTLIRARRHGG
jgi:GT2 family glycosyltransferase